MNKTKMRMAAIAAVISSAILFVCGGAWAADSVKLDPDDSMAEILVKASMVTPSPQQYDWQKLEYIAFIHFGMNTFTNREWGLGTEDEKLFNPTALDARQWVKVLKDVGVKQIILTAKHHDGFCLWQSKFTEHSVKNSPWKGGKGDVVKEFTDACREFDMRCGLYLSPWDRHEKTYGTPEYNKYYLGQLRELLSNYGKIWEVWFDGACGDGDERCKKMKYDWDGIYSTVRELQPDAVMFNNDLRWVGNEAGDARDSEWSVVPEGFDAMAQDIGSRKKLIEAAKRGETLRWRPAETDTSIRPGWFYHKFDDFSVKSAEKLIDIYFDAVGGNSVLLLNVPPDTRGLINANDIKALNKVRRTLDSIFKVNFISGAKATASSEDGTNKAALAADGDIDTSWRPAGADASPWIEFDLGAERTFNVAMLQEDIKQGQRVEEFLLEAWNGKNWIPVEISTTIGYKRLLRFDDVKAEKVRVSFTKLRGTPSLAETGLFYYEKKK